MTIGLCFLISLSLASTADHYFPLSRPHTQKDKVVWPRKTMQHHFAWLEIIPFNAYCFCSIKCALVFVSSILMTLLLRGRYLCLRALNILDVLCVFIILLNIFPILFTSKKRARVEISFCNNTDASTLHKKICNVEASLLFFNPYNNPVIVKDVSYQRYYAMRDLQGWTIAFNNRSMHVVERSITSSVSSSDFSIFICLTLSAHDKYCIKPRNIKNLEQWQRYGQLYGLRNILWRKDSFCWSMKESLSGFKSKRNFTFPCWVLPHDMEALHHEMQAHPNQPYIVKPDNKGEGHGIFVVHSYHEILDKGTIKGYVVQPFLKVRFLRHALSHKKHVQSYNWVFWVFMYAIIILEYFKKLWEHRLYYMIILFT